MSGLTLSFATTRPLTAPTAAEIASTATTAGSIMPGSPRMMNEAITAPTLIRLPTDRSIEPARMTKVWPSAVMPSATMRCSRPTIPPRSSWLSERVQSATATESAADPRKSRRGTGAPRCRDWAGRSAALMTPS